jgi:hypothetical protein
MNILWRGNCLVTHLTVRVNVRSHLIDFFDLWSCCYITKSYYKNSLYRQNKVEHLNVLIKMLQLHEKDQLYTNVYFFHLLLH